MHATGSILPSESGFNVIRMEWSSDSSKILYTVQNEKGRPWKVLTMLRADHKHAPKLFSQGWNAFILISNYMLPLNWQYNASIDSDLLPVRL